MCCRICQQRERVVEGCRCACVSAASAQRASMCAQRNATTDYKEQAKDANLTSDERLFINVQRSGTHNRQDHDFTANIHNRPPTTSDPNDIHDDGVRKRRSREAVWRTSA